MSQKEDQLRSPFEQFMKDLGRITNRQIVCTGETLLPGRLGKPDYAIHVAGALVGFVELKAPGTGANPKRFTGHNLTQANRFRAFPNLMYSDGNDWGLFRNGEPIGPIVRFEGDVQSDGNHAVTAANAEALLGILTDFLTWQPTIPTTARGQVDLRQLAALLAPLCRKLRQDVGEALADPNSPLVQLARDWRQLLFSDADNDQFADAYAQTVTFALLLARSDGADPLSLASAEAALAAEHSLLSRALRVLTDPNAQEEISASVNILVRVIGAVPPLALSGPKDPWLYFYEDFLAAYDPKLRKDYGAYYTPVEVVRAQVRLVDDLLTNRLGKTFGFADHGVVTLDPAVGTGTYLLGVIDHALSKIAETQGEGAVAGMASELAKNVYGFEIMVGPFAVSELRISRALQARGAEQPDDGTHIYLTDTLESPNTPPPPLPLILRPIADQHARALRVKSAVPVIVCIGNPPYDRHDAVDPEGNLAKYGGWVHFGDPPTEEATKSRGADGRLRSYSPARILEMREKNSIFWKNFKQPAIAAGHGGDIKNLNNLYVYFWCWALWKVFEQEHSHPGVVSFISASSYLDGDAFAGMREHMRRVCDEVWILDLGGEGRGTRQTENVFAIQTPVAIAVAARFGKVDESRPAKVWYAKLDGTREEKLQELRRIEQFASVNWTECPSGWHDWFRPAGTGNYFKWPLLTDLFPWQHSGPQFKRTWPISPDRETLVARWRAFLASDDRAAAFRETRDRSIERIVPNLMRGKVPDPALKDLRKNTATPLIERYSYRSFDRQFILVDNRLGDFLRPDLWEAHSDDQVYLTTLLNHPLGQGPAVTATALMPDLHHFRGSFGAKEVIPLYRDKECAAANILPALLDLLVQRFGFAVTAADFLAYVYGILAQPSFTRRFEKELSTKELRVPITKDGSLFADVRECGKKLLWLHTHGTRFVPRGRTRGRVPRGAARCTKAVSGTKANYPDRYEFVEATLTLRVGDGEFAPVAPEVYNFEVSGLMVVQSWLDYRMKDPKGKKSSPLDDIHPERWTGDFTTELLELLWVLEATLEVYPEQARLLAAVTRKATIRL